jgi:LacI family transcriptional regulator
VQSIANRCFESRADIAVTRQVKMKDIAQSLGLSVATVSRALAGSPRISQKTQARVRAAADRHGYVVDLAARTMRSGTSSIVGLLLPDIENDFYSTAAKAIADCCRERGAQLVLAITNDDAELELHHMRNLCSARALGIITIPSVAPAAETLRLMRSTPHVQFVRNEEAVKSDWFGIDDAQAIRLATEHLIRLGHRRIAYIGSTLAISTGRIRLAGFRRALEDAGIPVDEALVRADSCDADFGYSAMDAILAARPRPTGVVTAGARICVGAYDCIGDRGIDVPRDLSFVGFSDGPMLKWCGQGITTIALPVRDLALATTDHLFRRAADERRKGEAPIRVMLLPTLVERNSTAAPGAGRAARAPRTEALAPLAAK